MRRGPIIYSHSSSNAREISYSDSTSFELCQPAFKNERDEHGTPRRVPVL